MSWMADPLIEGFAAYGKSLHPGFFEPPAVATPDEIKAVDTPDEIKAVDTPDETRTPRCRDTAHDHHRIEISYLDEWLDRSGYDRAPIEPAPPPRRGRPTRVASFIRGQRTSPDARATGSVWRAFVLSPLARLWSIARNPRRPTLMIQELDTLDDRTLRDIGMSRCQIEHRARNGDYYG
jgi:uncharacterized protein YjiS (DUF1127 family)